MSLDVRRPDRPAQPSLFFTGSELEYVFPNEDDLVVIFVVMVRRKVHKVLIDQGSSADVMFWGTFTSLQISPDQLRPYDGCLVSFAGDQVEVQGYVEMKTTFSYENAVRTINVKYIIANASFAYNLLLGRPSLNRLGAIALTAHMKMKLPSLEEGVIVIKANQKTTQKCYESSLKNRRGAYAVIILPRGPGWMQRCQLAMKGDLNLLERFKRGR